MQHQSIDDASVPTRVLHEGQGSAQNDAAAGVTLILTPQEVQLCEALREAAQAFADGRLRLEGVDPTPLTIRIAGGWVRDHLLAAASTTTTSTPTSTTTTDVDVAIDALTGVQFATLVQQHLQLTKRVAVIHANPAQSKHLETATLRTCGLDVDYTQLRAHEVYTEHSRIPTVVVGTPLQDAQRRDFTANALFFNLHTRSIEDWTGRGVGDLFGGRLVTPLDPEQTFRDDPLRLLRAVRFAVRLDWTLDEAIVQVSGTSLAKVSRERVGSELEGMLSGKGARPTRALELLVDLHLAGEVFGPAETWSRSKSLVQCLDRVQSQWVLATSNTEASTLVDSRLLPLAVFLSPLRGMSYTSSSSRPIPWISHVVKERLKFKNKDVAALTTIAAQLDAFATLLREPPVCRLDAGLLLRATKELWVTCLWTAVVVLQEEEQDQDWVSRGLETYQAIVVRLHLDECWKQKPLLNGKELMTELELTKGPIVQTYVEEQTRWMLLYPDGSPDECRAHLRKVKRHLEGFPTDRESSPKKSNVG